MQTIDNFRDSGGYPTTDGRRTRLGVLYRSGSLDHARGADLQALHALGLKTIVDLRAPGEKKSPPVIDSARRVDLPIELENRTRQKVQPLMTRRGAERDVIEIMRQMYRDLADEAWPQAGQFLRLLLTAEAYPVLVHCRAGKDRTGFMCALVQHAVGVARPLVLHDYLKTNAYFGPATQRLIRMTKILSLGRVRTENIRAALSAREEYLQAALDQIERCHGGLTAYLAKCGITSREVEQLRDLLVD